MQSSRAVTRVATSGLAVLLAGGGLVAVTGGAASAGTNTTSYACAIPELGLAGVPVPVTGSVPDLPDQPLGTTVPAGGMNPTYVVDLAGLSSALASVTAVSGKELGVGSEVVDVTDLTESDGAYTGTNAPFTLDQLGAQPVTMGESFTMTAVPLALPGPLPLPAPDPVTVTCLSDAPAVLGSLMVVEPTLSSSTTEATLAKKKIRKGKRAKVTAEVASSPSPMPATGKVVVKKRKRTIGRGTLDDGTVTIRTKVFMKRGRYTLKVKYLGDETTSRSKDTVVLRVRRRR